ncbi:MAG: DUF1573 domain-containing protein [Bacteroidia bacterium]|nr:DUF1573 domain-containing protein [Bacteroidia bacterium]
MSRTIPLNFLLLWVFLTFTYAVGQNPSGQNGFLRGGPFSWTLESRNIGPMVIGDVTEINFFLTNKSNRVVTIKEVVSSHRDVIAMESQKTIQPNEVAYITAKVAPRDEGRLKAEITVKTDYGNFNYSLKLYANCYPISDRK